MSEKMQIESHKGMYDVHFKTEVTDIPLLKASHDVHYLVDEKIAQLYERELSEVLSHHQVVLIEATEQQKSLEKIIPVIERMVEQKVRRGHTLVAIGGGIIQDITCFIASTLLRGVRWCFIPTTLLAQADSCIGSKSSINLGAAKNILGTFNPPSEIYISTDFLKTLDRRDVFSGVGEILKVHAIDGLDSFLALSRDYDELFEERAVLLRYIRRALEIKKGYIEKDEFDQGIRNIFNYGHSFGHAIEAATNFGIPHGIAVSLGMDMANHIAESRGMISKENRDRLSETLRKNYSSFLCPIPMEPFLAALLKDKKNTSTQLVLILPTGPHCEILKHEVSLDEAFKKQCKVFFEELNIEHLG